MQTADRAPGRDALPSVPASSPAGRSPWVIHPLVFAVHPALFLYAHNIAQVPASAVLVAAIVLLVLALSLWLPLRLALGSWARSGLIVSFFLVACFSYRHLYDLLAPTDIQIVSLAINGMLVAGLGLALVALLFLCRRSRRAGTHLPTLTRILNVVGLSLLLVPALRVAGHLVTQPAERPRTTDALPEPATQPALSPLPNIYYIILDAYARADVLRELYHYDNSPFLKALRQRGFFVADKSRSNYYVTGQSLPSSMNFQYLSAIDDLDLNHSRVVQFLRSHGYLIAAFAIGIDSLKLVEADLYLGPGWTLDDFHEKLLSTTPLGLLLDDLGVWDEFEMRRRRIRYTLGHLSEACRTGRPTFVYAHVLCPHPPFVFGPRGERRTPDSDFRYDDGDRLVTDEMGGLTRDQYVSQYVDQVRFVNSRLLPAIDDIIDHAPRPTIIVLQADHGPRSRLKWGRPDQSCLTECFAILNACYVNGRPLPQLHARLTPVNTFRVLFNHIFRTGYVLLPDRSYFGDGDFVDVTERLDLEEQIGFCQTASPPADDDR